jgi:hypothetical protein
MTPPSGIVGALEEALAKQPMLDVHTHIDAGHLTARGLHDVLLYHMVISDLYAAGCGDGQRLSEQPDESECLRRLERAMPYVGLIRNTSCYWGVRTILRDLYGFDEPLAAENWRKADGLIRHRSGDRSWARQILARANVKGIGTELCRRGNGSADDILQYSVESAFFTRVQSGQNDAPLYELERTWGCGELPAPVSVNLGSDRPAAARVVRCLADAREAMAHYCGLIPYGKVLATAQHLSTDIRYRLVSDREMEQAIARRTQASEADRDIYASYLLDLFLDALSEHADKIVYQFSLGAEPLPCESASRLSQETIGQLAEILHRHPTVRFMCFLSSRHGNQSLCTLARELPNLSLAGYWWHNFFPDSIRQVMNERLDMLPVNKQVGFFSDAYCLDWMYAKAIIVRKQLACVLAGKVAQGQYTLEEALHIAGEILLESPRNLLNITS